MEENLPKPTVDSILEDDKYNSPPLKLPPLPSRRPSVLKFQEDEPPSRKNTIFRNTKALKRLLSTNPLSRENRYVSNPFLKGSKILLRDKSKHSGTILGPDASTALYNLLPSYVQLYAKPIRNQVQLQYLENLIQRFIRLEIALMFVVFVGIIQAAVQLEYLTLRDFEWNEMAYFLQISLIFSTLLAVGLTWMVYSAHNKVLAHGAPLAIPILKNSLLASTLLETLVELVIPFKYFEFTIESNCGPSILLHDQCYFNSLQSLSALTIFLRISLLVILIFRGIGSLSSRRFRILSNFAGVETTKSFRIRKLIYEQPLTVIVVIYVLYFSVIGYLHMAWERSTTSCVEHGYFFCGYFDAIWLHLVTAFTVGYGDLTPNTYIGRCLSIFSMFFGMIAGAAMVAIATQNLQFDRTETILIQTLREYDYLDRMSENAAILIQKTYRSYRYRMYRESKRSARTSNSLNSSFPDSFARQNRANHEKIRRQMVVWNTTVQKYRATRKANEFAMQPMVERVDNELKELREKVSEMSSMIQKIHAVTVKEACPDPERSSAIFNTNGANANRKNIRHPRSTASLPRSSLVPEIPKEDEE